MVLKKHNVCLDGKLLKVFTVTSLGVFEFFVLLAIIC